MRIGIDLGGTKIEGVVLDGDGAVAARRRVATPRGAYDDTLAALAALIAELEATAGAEAPVGIGTPGAISPATGRLKNSNSTWLNGQRLAEDLERRVGRPLRFANDANCFALSEAIDGAGAGARVVFGVILGTGTGGGLVVDGQVITGPNAIAGEWGHNPMPWPREKEWLGPLCYCGRTGCIETFLSGPGFARDHQLATGVTLAPEEIVARALAGDAEADESLARYEERLARALASVINVLDPDVIVLGGGMSNCSRLYETVPETWPTYVFSDRVDTRLAPPRHGDASGALGAARLWPER
ncbi:MAG: ROK family protein [Acidobacteria bacterium]|nr:ROK family protein [Acidobacteriota bacterium]